MTFADAGPGARALIGALSPHAQENGSCSSLVVYDVEREAYAVDMWDVLTWHNGTLAIAWWAVIVLIVALLSIGGTAAARRK